MPEYRRPRKPGATIFFTVCLARRGSGLLVERIDVLREVVRQTRRDRGFRIDAWVTLPDHFHAVLTLAPGDADYPNLIGAVKARFTRDVRRAGSLPPPGRDARDGDAGIWQPRYRERHIRTGAALRDAVTYCNLNPVKHGLAADPFDWPYSSIHRDMRDALAAGMSQRAARRARTRPAGERRAGAAARRPSGRQPAAHASATRPSP